MSKTLRSGDLFGQISTKYTDKLKAHQYLSHLEPYSIKARTLSFTGLLFTQTHEHHRVTHVSWNFCFLYPKKNCIGQGSPVKKANIMAR